MTDIVTYCDVNTCEDCPRYGDDCDGDKRVEHTDLRDWIIGCIKHDGFIHTHRFDKANQIILEALQNEQMWIPFKKRPLTDEEREEYPDLPTLAFNYKLKNDGRSIADYICDYNKQEHLLMPEPVDDRMVRKVWKH